MSERQTIDFGKWPTQCLIDGMWVGAGRLEVINPADGTSLAHVPDLGRGEIDTAIDAARRAFRPWADLLSRERAAILRAWFDLVVEHADELAAILTSEQGKPFAEALGEIGYAASFLAFYAEEATRIHGDIIPSDAANSRILVWREPIGVVAAITPWNFPAAMITRKVAPALAAGCTAIVKPAPETPLTALALARLAQKAGLPAGVLNVVTGDARTIGETLCESEHVRALSFTGSTSVGKHLMAQCAATVKRVGLELGGNAPFIVFEDADIDAAVTGAILSKFRNSGQTCVCANRFYVHASVHDVFVGKLAAAAALLKVGDGFATDVAQGPLINEAALRKVEAHVADALRKGASLVTGGRGHALGRWFFEPTVLSGATRDMLIATEEVFGPVAAIFRFDSEDEVISLANDTPYGLAAYFYSRDISRIWRVAEALDCGMVAVNRGSISTAVAPFGGVKQSGIGREGSRHGLEEFTEFKYVLMGT